VVDLWSLTEFKDDNDIVYCNLYKCCKRLNSLELNDGKRRKLIEIVRELHNNVTDDTTFISYSGDWGIKHSECKITKNPRYAYTIEDAAHGGVYLNLEINSVSNTVRRWYMTNMAQPLPTNNNNIYPIPLNVKPSSFDDVDVEKLRNTEKNKICYSNFTITSPYRIRVAEWAWQQHIIDCNFPKRYDTQDVELNMPILRGDKLELKDFLKTLASYQFALAPTGNGMDTFRTWECILCNTVPIVQDKWMNRVFSRIWPMILVDRYEFSNLPKLIDDFFEEHGSIKYDYSLLLRENFNDLLDRVQYESDGLRREEL